jgi:hypothetical protein
MKAGKQLAWKGKHWLVSENQCGSFHSTDNWRNKERLSRGKDFLSTHFVL